MLGNDFNKVSSRTSSCFTEPCKTAGMLASPSARADATAASNAATAAKWAKVICRYILGNTLVPIAPADSTVSLTIGKNFPLLAGADAICLHGYIDRASLL